ncbi:hypothetical protein [Kaarinaea lacus]
MNPIPSAATDSGPWKFDSWNFKGHTKYKFFYTHYQDNTWLSQLGAQNTDDHFGDIRLMIDNRWNEWDTNIHYQLIGVTSETLKVTQSTSPTNALFTPGIVTDKSKLFNLTHVFHESDGQVVLQRLDRLTLGYTGQNLVVRVGREAISWGNGLFYNPMDVFNPFAPDAVDKDYKSGDDLAYLQWLFQSGDDLQAVLVPRRNLDTGKVDAENSSAAAKFHGFFAGKEYDVLAAQHYDQTMLAIGLATDWRETVVRGDIIATHTKEKIFTSAVANISYSWMWFNKNVSGFLEYFHNGFGQDANNYSPEALAANPQLLERIQRGELYTLGKHYIGANISLETTPLTLLSTNLFVNIADPSALLQVVYNFDWRQNLTMFSGLSLPMGAAGSEFGGIPTGTADVYYSSGNAVFLQLAYFF